MIEALEVVHRNTRKHVSNGYYYTLWHVNLNSLRSCLSEIEKMATVILFIANVTSLE